MDTDDTSAVSNVSPVVNVVIKISAAMMLLIISLTALQVFLRYVMGFSLSWVEEVSRYLFVWIVLLGSATAFALNEHIAVDILTERTKGCLLLVIESSRILLSCLALGLILYSGILVAWRHRSGSFYTLQGVPSWLFYAAVPVGAVLAISFLAVRLKRLFSTP